MKNVITVLKETREREKISGLIAVIDDLEVLENYRGSGYGNFFLKDIIKYLHFIEVNYLGLIPVLLVSDQYIYSEKINQFYIQHNFKPLVTKLGEKPIMDRKI